MKHLARALSTFALAGALVLAYGCSSSGGGGGGGGNSSGNGAGNSGTTTPACSTTCSSGSDCPNVVCNCTDGTPINTTSCSNGCCDDAAAACPGSCSANGGWAG